MKTGDKLKCTNQIFSNIDGGILFKKNECYKIEKITVEHIEVCSEYYYNIRFNTIDKYHIEDDGTILRYVGNYFNYIKVIRQEKIQQLNEIEKR